MNLDLIKVNITYKDFYIKERNIFFVVNDNTNYSAFFKTKNMLLSSEPMSHIFEFVFRFESIGELVM